MVERVGFVRLGAPERAGEAATALRAALAPWRGEVGLPHDVAALAAWDLCWRVRFSDEHEHAAVSASVQRAVDGALDGAQVGKAWSFRFGG